LIVICGLYRFRFESAAVLLRYPAAAAPGKAGKASCRPRHTLRPRCICHWQRSGSRPQRHMSTCCPCRTTGILSHIFPAVKHYSWSRSKLKPLRQFSTNQSSSGSFIARIAFSVCFAAESKSALPAFCSSMHLI